MRPTLGGSTEMRGLAISRVAGLAILSAMFSGCATTLIKKQTTLSAEEWVQVEARKKITESGQLLHSETPSAEAMTQAKALGVRTDGFYWWNEEGRLDESFRFRKKSKRIYTMYIRFCEDGSVASASTSGLPEQVKPWLTCGPLDPGYSHGVVKLEGDRMHFRLYMWTGEIDYWGSVKRQSSGLSHALELRSISRIKSASIYGKVLNERFAFHPFKP